MVLIMVSHGTHYPADLTESTWIKCLAQGHNILTGQRNVREPIILRPGALQVAVVDL